MNKVDFRIRHADVSDAESLWSYLHQIAGETDYLSFGLGEFTKSIQDQRDFIKNLRLAYNCLIVVAEIDSEIAGLLTIKAVQKPRLRHNGELGISVRKPYWGLGIGKSLLEHMFNWAKANSVIKKINLTVVETNVKAIELYEKYGFTKEGALIKDFYLNGNYYNGILMGCWVG